MGTTTRGYRYPESTDAPNVPLDLKELAEDVDADVASTRTLINTNRQGIHMRLELSGSAPFGSAQFYLPTWDVTARNDGFDRDGRLMVVPTAGFYLLQAQMTYTESATGIRRAMVRINQTGNGTPAGGVAPTGGYWGADSSSVAISSWSGQATMTAVRYLNAGDTLGFYAYQNSGGTLSIRNESFYTWCEATFMGS